MIAIENIEECRNCGEELDRDGVGVIANSTPYGVMGYFCDDTCQLTASEAQWERRQSGA